MSKVEKTQSDELLRGFEQLARKYAELNLLFWKEGAKMLTHWAANSSNRSAGNETLRNSFHDWLTVSHQHLDDLIDLGKNAAQRFNEAYQQNTTATKTEPSDAIEQPPHRVGLNLKGHPGETIIRGFNLKSNNNEQRSGHFETTLFHLENGKAATPSFQPVFLPDSFFIAPGADLPVRIETELPPETQPGVYRAHVTVRGFEQASFDVVLTVEKGKKPVRKSPQPRKGK